MRRLLTAAGLALVTAAALAGTALAKEMSVSLSAGAPPSEPGERWNAELLVHGEPDMLAEATPGVTIRNDASGESRTFSATRTGRRAADGQLIYRVPISFPSEGTWAYSVIDGVTEREYEGGTVTIGQPASAPSPAPTRADPASAAADDSSLPSWPFVAGGIALVLGAVGGAVALRQRLQPSA